MKTKAEKDILQEYRDAGAEGRLDIMLANYCTFPKLIRKLEMKTRYKIKCEKECLKSRARAELGVRVQNSKISKPTEDPGAGELELSTDGDTKQTGGKSSSPASSSAVPSDSHFQRLRLTAKSTGC